MNYVLLAALLALAGAWILHAWRIRRRHRVLSEAARARNVHLSETLTIGPSRTSWDELCVAFNKVIEEGREAMLARDGLTAQLASTLEQLDQAVIIADEDNRIVHANAALRAHFPQHGPMVGMRVQRILPNPQFFSFLEDIRRGTSDLQREFAFGVGGESRSFRIRAGSIPGQPGQAGSPPWLLLTLLDLTEQRRMESAQKDFVANVSHELRTPISVIRGYTETLVSDHETMTATERTRFLQAIERHALRLSSLVEDLLIISRLDSRYPGLVFDAVDLHDLLHHLIVDFQVRADRTGHRIEVRLTAARTTVSGDALRLSQVVENLFDNALKYTPRGSRVEIATSSSEREVTFSIADNGPGIPERDLPRIFERFYRVEKGRSRDKGGTGLGLSIVHDIVQLHHGQVWVESHAGEGTRFSVSLPLLRPPNAAASGSGLADEATEPGAGAGPPESSPTAPAATNLPVD